MSLWTPAQFTSRVGWWDAQAITGLVDGNAISTWADLTASGWNATASGIDRPTYRTGILNGKPIVQFNGTNHLSLGSVNLFRGVGGGTVYAVIRDTAITSRSTVLNASTPAGNARLILSSGNLTGSNDKYLAGGRRLDADSFASVSSTQSVTSNWTLCGCVANWSGRVLSLFVNAVLDGEDAAWHSGGNTSDTATEVNNTAIGATSTSSANGFNGDIAEIVVTHSALNTENRQLLEGYLAWKWGLQANLPNDHPYKSGAPTTGAQRRVINDGLFNRGLFGRSLVR